VIFISAMYIGATQTWNTSMGAQNEPFCTYTLATYTAFADTCVTTRRKHLLRMNIHITINQLVKENNFR